ncbi:DUF4403 family protein [Roseibium aggregatum]|uniref:DUF4403 family protein n=1 Tax=Roseibium aggregatum TaxID=187304 RepID=UPI001E5E8040|nr:DUF4403 family protein [Roseibium aggregatum]
MKHALLHSLLFFFFTGFAAMASSESPPESRISVPVTIGLQDLARYANERLPGTLHQNEYGRTCVEPERVCTKVPEFRGLKVTFKDRCVDVSPRIECTVTETVRREGPIRISGAGGQIVLRQDIFGSGTVRGRGDLGKNIHQTVRAKAELTISASPRTAPDWTPEMPVDISYRWLDRPEFKLFNLFPVTLGSTLGPPLDQAINDFKARGLADELDRIDLRTEAERLWLAVQVPHRLDLPGDEALYLHLRPHAIGLTGPTFGSNALRVRLDLALTAQVSGDENGPQTTSLPNLTPMEDAGVALKVPVRIDTGTLNSIAGKQLPKAVHLGEEGSVSVTIHQADIAIDGDRLALEMVVDATGGPFSLKRKAIRVRARPVWMLDSQALQFSEINLEAVEGGLSGLATSAVLGTVEAFLEDTYTLSLNDEIARLEEALNAAMNRELTPEFSITGSGHLQVEDLLLLPEASALQVTFSSTGDVRVVGFNPMR